jgi:hypothetical protein
MKGLLVAVIIGGLAMSSAFGAASKTPAPMADNPVMRSLFAEDQRVRLQNVPAWQWGDDKRREQVHKLLAENALKTGKDFEEAAFIFQHGDTPDDYLLGHTLAMVAVAKGDARALWIATATLDRYLQAIGRKQIFGTQFRLLPGINGKIDTKAPWTQEPYDPTLVPDSLRTELGVVPPAVARSLLIRGMPALKPAK